VIQRPTPLEIPLKNDRGECLLRLLFSASTASVVTMYGPLRLVRNAIGASALFDIFLLHARVETAAAVTRPRRSM
jgi:hypothetical protein